METGPDNETAGRWCFVASRARSIGGWVEAGAPEFDVPKSEQPLGVAGPENRAPLIQPLQRRTPPSSVNRMSQNRFCSIFPSRSVCTLNRNRAGPPASGDIEIDDALDGGAQRNGGGSPLSPPRQSRAHAGRRIDLPAKGQSVGFFDLRGARRRPNSILRVRPARSLLAPDRSEAHQCLELDPFLLEPRPPAALCCPLLMRPVSRVGSN